MLIITNVNGVEQSRRDSHRRVYTAKQGGEYIRSFDSKKPITRDQAGRAVAILDYATPVVETVDDLIAASWCRLHSARRTGDR